MRQTSLLNEMRFTVLGHGEAATTTARILRALGGVVRHLDANVSDLVPALFADDEVVICDCVEEPIPDRYLTEVSERGEGAWITLSAFGLDHSGDVELGSDLVCAAAGGLLASVADADGCVYPMPGTQALRMTGQIGALAALQAVSLIRDGGRGVHLDVSAQEAVAFCSIQQECAHLLYKCPGFAGPGRYSAPSGTFQCSDGDIQITVLDDHQWHRLAGVLDLSDMARTYVTNVDRVNNADSINDAVSGWTRHRSKFECESLLQEAGVAAAAIRSIQETADLEQFAARAFNNCSEDKIDFPELPALVSGGTGVTSGGMAVRGLSAMRVAEITNVLAGPLAGAILGAMGAEVVRLEEEDRLDLYRRNGPFGSGVQDRERAAYFIFANHSKKSITKGIGTDSSYTASVFRWADLLLENVGSRRLERLAYRAAGGQDRTLTPVSVSGFGRTGPCRDYKAYASTIHAFAGMTGAVRSESGEKARIRTSIADYCTAVWAATLAVAWWLGGSTSSSIDVSMAETVAAKLRDCAFTPSQGSHECKQVLVRCDDGEVALAGGRGSDVTQALRLMGIVDDGLQMTRRAGVAVLDLRGRSVERDDVLRGGRAAGLRGCLSKTAEEFLADKTIAARGFVVHLHHPVIGDAPVFALPWKEAGIPRSGYRRAPLLGEHDDWMGKTLNVDLRRERTA